MQQTEDPEYVRRRGRWASAKVMDIYVQEVASVLYLPRLPEDTKHRIFRYANLLERMLAVAEQWDRFHFPPDTWFFIGRHGAEDACTNRGCLNVEGAGNAQCA